MALWLGAAGLAAGLLGCTRGVEVALPPRAGDPSCLVAGTRWPAAVGPLSPVPVTPAAPAVRAWGDPAVIARCGVAPLGPTPADCISVDGVDWVAEPLSDGTRFTTYGRDPAIEVLVPRRYAPEPLQLPVFTDAARALPENGRRCT